MGGSFAIAGSFATIAGSFAAGITAPVPRARSTSSSRASRVQLPRAVAAQAVAALFSSKSFIVSRHCEPSFTIFVASA